jgi:ferric-dicitrate binding protein FerR (iron transport regulator)
VLLGANSRLEYPTHFAGKSREVTLSGEARFHVAKREGMPFIVHTQELQTQVFGTVFDVRAYPQGTPDVALYEGSIGVTYRGEEHLMQPGEQAFISTDGALQLTATPSHRSSWAEGYFTYDNQDLRTVMREIGTWYNLSVTFETARLLDERIHFRFPRHQPVDVILQVLGDMGIAQFVRGEEGIVVR